MKAFCPFRRGVIGPAVFEGNILLLLQFLPIFPVGLRFDPARCALTEQTITLLNAGCCRFLILTQRLKRPAR